MTKGTFYTAIYLCISLALVNCEWSGWSSWTECSMTCAHGYKSSTRTCTAQPCNGRRYKTKACFLTPCSEIGVLSSWSRWTTCHGTCGVGYRTQARTCSNNNCQGNLTSTENCNGGCRLSECPMKISEFDCNFETPCWLSDQTRQWVIDSYTPSPSTGPDVDHTFPSGCGHFAYYEASYRAKGHAAYLATLMFVPMQSQYCFSFYVSMYTRYPRYMGSLHVYLVNGLTYSQTLLWENYGVLTYNASHWKNINIDVDVVVGGTNMSFLFKAVKGIGYNSDIAIDDGTLVVGQCAGPVHGNWAPWENWGTCSVDCGPGGTRSRSRNCTMPEANNNGDNCFGSATMIGPCPVVISCPVHGNWSQWSNWTQCSKTCDNGTQFRLRECHNPPPQFGGSNCTRTNGTMGLEEEEKRYCATTPCYRQGGWSEWFNITSCPQTCGNETYERNRTCNNPAPIGDGSLCLDLKNKEALNETDTAQCPRCPVHGGWSMWSSTACSATCGTGANTRSRTCTNPIPLFGGNNCRYPSGNSGLIETRKQPCITQGCAACSFESAPDRATSCFFQYPRGDDNRWRIHNGPTKSLYTGPSDDHTFGNSSGYYVYFESSRGPPDTRTKYSSSESYFAMPNLPPVNGVGCLTFWLQMNETFPAAIDWGSFWVVQIINEIEVVLFTRNSSLPDDKWHQTQINLTSSPDVAYEIRFYAIAVGSLADRAIDDISINSGACPKLNS